MKKAISIILLMLSLISIDSVYGQNSIDKIIASLKKKYPIPTFTKEQMYEDFDTLTSIMKNCDAQYLVRKKVTGFDMLQEMGKLRPQIDTVSSTQSFVRILRDALFLAQDEHCDIGINVWYYKYMFYEKQAKHIKDKAFGYNFHYVKEFYKDVCFFGLLKDQDHYFIKYPTRFYYRNDSLDVKTGCEILSINNSPISLYLDSVSKYQSSARWDFNKKKFYTNLLYLKRTQGKFKLIIDNMLIEVEYDSIAQFEPTFNFKGNKDRVKYFPNDSILFIRVPSMGYSKDRMKLLSKDILSFNQMYIKKVVIDIRGNRGGDDSKWTEILRTIIESPIKYHFSLLTTDNKDSYKYLTERLKNKYLKYDFIDTNYCYKVNYDEEVEIKPFEKNLGYKGKIFILQDEEIFSSAKSFSSLNTKTDRVITVGVPTGKLVGQGVIPNVFILPNTKLIFTLDVVLDASGVNKAEDFYHDSVNYPVTPTLNYYLYRLKATEEELLDEKYLHEFDEIYKKVLGL